MKLAVWVLPLFAGCATLGYDVEGAKRSWQGARYEDVVTRWGAPARHTTFNDGRHVYTWDSERTGSVGVSPTIGIYGGSGGIGVGVGVGVGGSGYDRPRCERTLIFRDGVVVEQTWLGAASYCSRFTR